MILARPHSSVEAPSLAALAAQGLQAHLSTTALTLMWWMTGCLEAGHSPTILGLMSQTLNFSTLSKYTHYSVSALYKHIKVDVAFK